MKMTVIAVLLTMSGAAFATADCTPGTVGSLSPQCNRPTTNQTFNNTPRVTVSPTLNNTAVGYGEGGAGGNASAGASAQALGQGTGGSVGNVSPSFTVNTERSAYAPDVISYPTAHCRIALGGSGGNGIISFGFSSSVLDENCELIELSKHATLTLGQRDVGAQIMCLSPKVRQVYEAMGVKCLVALPEAPAEPVRP